MKTLFEGFQTCHRGKTKESTDSMGFLAKAAFTDIFEDYRLEAGTRISTNLDGAEFFLTYDNNKNSSINGGHLPENQTEKRLCRVHSTKSKSKHWLVSYSLFILDLQSFRQRPVCEWTNNILKTSEISTLPCGLWKRLGLRVWNTYW